MENLGAESGVQTPLSMYSTTVSIGDAELSTTMDVSFFSHFHNWNAVPHQHSYHELFFLVVCNQCNIHNAPPFLSGWSGG